jgi:hypothetical protein
VSRPQLAAILVAGAVLRLAALPGPGTGDVTIFKVWSYNAARGGVGAMYGVGGSPPERRLLDYQGTTAVVDYPPLALYELGVAGRIHRAWSGRRFPNDAALNTAVKLPSLAADVSYLALILFLTWRYFGVEAARWAAAAWWLNPAPIIDASVLGYLDMQYVVPAAAAIVAAAHGRSALAGVLAGAAILTKAQGIFIAPAVALAIWNCGARDRRAQRVAAAAAAALAVAAAVVAPVVGAGGWTNMVQALGRLAHHDSLSAQACNLWWLVGYVVRIRYSARDMGLWPAIVAPARILAGPRVVELGYPDPKIIGAALTTAAMLWALWTARRARDVWSLAGAGAFIAHAYATLSAQVHENHLFAVVPLLALAAVGRAGFRPILAVMSAVVALNLNLFYGFGDDRFALPRALTIVDATVMLAIVNCAALWWHARLLRRECSWAAEPLRSPAPA